MIDTDLPFRREFVLANTRVARPAIVPELALCLANPATPIWALSEEDLKSLGLPPPYWSYAWAGGQALGRYLLDHRAEVAGKRVIDFATGSGIVAIAAMKAGAVGMLAADIDPFCAAAVSLNAEANGVAVAFTGANLLDAPPPTADLILAADICYEKPMAEAVMDWLGEARAAGARVLIGDPGRAYFPKSGLAKLAEYRVPTSRELEDSEIKRTAVWTMAPA